MKKMMIVFITNMLISSNGFAFTISCTFTGGVGMKSVEIAQKGELVIYKYDPSVKFDDAGNSTSVYTGTPQTCLVSLTEQERADVINALTKYTKTTSINSVLIKQFKPETIMHKLLNNVRDYRIAITVEQLLSLLEKAQ